MNVICTSISGIYDPIRDIHYNLCHILISKYFIVAIFTVSPFHVLNDVWFPEGRKQWLKDASGTNEIFTEDDKLANVR